MPKNDVVRFRHMLDAAREAQGFIRGRTRQDLEQDRLLNLALVRLLEILGEAARRVTQQARDRYPQVPWSSISDMRNRLIHGYDEVNLDVVWQVLSSEIGPLIRGLEEILATG